MEKLCIKSIFENGWWEVAYSSSYRPGSAPCHKPQKASKKSGLFQPLGSFSFVLFTKRQSQKGGPWPNALPPKYVPEIDEWLENLSRWIEGTISRRIKPKTIKLVFTASLLDAQH